MISLLLHECEAKLWMSVTKKDNIQMFLGYNLLIPERTIPISASFVE